MKSLKSLLSFIWYCVRHPKERFWQALRNWLGTYNYIYVTKRLPENFLELIDTFYWE